MHYLIQQDLARARTARLVRPGRQAGRRSLRIALGARQRENARLTR